MSKDPFSPIDPYPEQLKVAQVLLDMAEKDLTRIFALYPEQRSKLAFYQAFSAAMIVAHVYSWTLFGINSLVEILCPAISVGLFASALFLSVMAMGNSNVMVGAVKSYSEWFLSAHGTQEDTLSIYRDALKNFDSARKLAKLTLDRRGRTLRRINILILCAIVFGAIGIVGLAA